MVLQDLYQSRSLSWLHKIQSNMKEHILYQSSARSFLIETKMGYPTPEEEFEILNRMEKSNPLSQLQTITTIEDLLYLQQSVQVVSMDKAIKHYIVKLVNQTRTYSSIQLGASPRGSIALMKASQAYAFIHGRNYVIPDDVKF